MNFWFGLLLGIAFGIAIGTIHQRSARRNWRCLLGRKLQLIAERNEMKGYRLKRKRPICPLRFGGAITLAE